MGCCQSTTNSSPYESPRPAAAPGGHDATLPRDSSRAAITQSSRALPNDQPIGSSSRLNQRIRAPSPLSRSPKNVSRMPPPWTRSHLEREREVFFETRVTGQPEVWSALDVVCQLIRKGEVEEAQGIMDAANITCPNGRVAKGRGRERNKGGVYDERGALYDIPEWVVADPRDVIEDGGAASAEKGVVEEDEDDEDDWEGGVPVDGEGDKEAISRPKGKGRAEDIGEEIRLRARLSDRGSDVEVTLGSKQHVRVAVQQIREQTGCNRVRLVYMGKPMDENMTLNDCGWRTGQVVNAFVFEGDESIITQKKTKKKT